MQTNMYSCMPTDYKTNYLAKLNFSSSRIVKHMNITNDNFMGTW